MGYVRDSDSECRRLVKDAADEIWRTLLRVKSQSQSLDVWVILRCLLLTRTRCKDCALMNQDGEVARIRVTI